jgi:2,3-bisphosphoglycerate-independent phosphoglycerate mutase
VGGTEISDSSPAAPHLALIVLDGLGDRPNPTTGGISPVDAAATPHLDALARAGRFGNAVVVAPKVAPESDAGVFALLGYNPVTDSPGRGVLEAEGVGIELAPEDVALRLNFATSDGAGLILDSRVGRSLGTTEAQELARALTAADLLADHQIRAEVRATVGHRGVLWLRPTSGGPLSPNVSNADPFYEKVGGMGQARRPDEPRLLPVRATQPSPEAERTAQAINAFLERVPEVLAGQRINARRAMGGKKLANMLLVRNAGARRPGVPTPFAEKYGLTGAAVTEMPVERGIARLLGLADLYVGPMGADRDEGYRSRAAATRRALEEHPFVYVHLKGPDEPGHDGDAQLKKEIVEAIDRSFFGPFLEGMDLTRARLAITADHSTPCDLKGHSDDPVPLLIVGAGVRAGATQPHIKFGDADAARGDLGHRAGSDVMPLLLGREDM